VAVWTNGGPFHKGDTVRILVGPHEGRVSRVYEEWKERNQVKVDLGAELSRKVEDVFSFIELKRERGAEPASPPYSEPAARSPQG
jgi:transcription antitermination factor NusG